MATPAIEAGPTDRPLLDETIGRNLAGTQEVVASLLSKYPG